MKRGSRRDACRRPRSPQEQARSSDVLIDGINVTLDWRKLGDAARVTGQARFHGETANISAWVRHPTDLLRAGGRR